VLFACIRQQHVHKLPHLVLGDGWIFVCRHQYEVVGPELGSRPFPSDVKAKSGVGRCLQLGNQASGENAVEQRRQDCALPQPVVHFVASRGLARRRCKDFTLVVLTCWQWRDK
jgi:hypothetical protein